MLGSIEIEDLSGDHFEIAFGATMPAAQIASVEADHDRRGHCVDLGIWCSGRTQPRNTLAHSAGPITHCAGVDPTADGQQLSKQISHFSERRERGALGGHIGEFGRHAALERKNRKTSWLFGEYLAARTILKGRLRSGTSPNKDRKVTCLYALLDKGDP